MHQYFVTSFCRGTVLGLLLIGWLGTGLAEKYYVAPSGNDSNRGSMGAPWKTISYAITKTKPGDTLLVRGGTYNEGEIWIRSEMGGADGKYLTISAFPYETPVFTNGNRGMIVDASYVRVIGLHFQNGKSLYNVDWAGLSHHVEFINNYFSGEFSWEAIGITGDSNLVQGNVMTLSGSSVGTQGHGIYASQGAHTIIRNNTISGMTGYGIHIFDQRRAAGEPPRLINDFLVEGNVIFGSKERAGIIVSAYDEAKAQNVVIRNNIIYHHAGDGIVIRDDVSGIKIYNNTIHDINTDNIDWTGNEGISISGGATGVEIRNNIISLKNKGVHIGVENAANVTAEHNLYWPSPLNLQGVSDAKSHVADPQFLDATNNDFRLAPSSPAIDAGVQVGIPYLGAAPDLGAIEFDGTSSTGGRGNKVEAFGLWQNYPNPFNSTTVIRYNLAETSYVRLDIFDHLGQHVTSLVDGRQESGEATVNWDGTDDNGKRVSSGVYFYRLQHDGISSSRKMLLLQ